MRFQRVLRALDEIRAGRMVILVDDEDRENEGDLTMAAEKVTPEAINFMARHGRGLICLTLTEERIARLQLPMMVHDNRAPMGTAFTVSIEARHGVTTGISAQDRAVTIQAAVSRDARAEDVVSPGHVFPLKARRGGVLVRTGQTEGSVDLARLAGLEPAGVICEIMRDDGQMARMPDLERFAEEHGLLIVSIAELIDYRLQNERLIHRLSSGTIRPSMPQLGAAEFTSHVFGNDVEDTEYLALVVGDPAAAAARGEPVLVRVQSMCPVGDVFASRACDCRWQLEESLRVIAKGGLGVFLYVHPRSRTSLRSAFDAHVLHTSRDAAAATTAPQAGALRDFGLGAQVLADLGVRKIRLLSNNPKKIAGIGGYGIEVVERVPIEAAPTSENAGWLRERREREGHLLVAMRGGPAEGKDG
jgi:3,4-dihydroxy 2-butanone 4-phosphate synthase/GTP cyclohydrolase II